VTVVAVFKAEKAPILFYYSFTSMGQNRHKLVIRSKAGNHDSKDFAAD
jgi:hypothetical protein